MLPWFIIIALASLIAGFVPGILLGVHITRGHFPHMGIQTSMSLPQPHPQTRALHMERLPSRRTSNFEEEEPYY